MDRGVKMNRHLEINKLAKILKKFVPTGWELHYKIAEELVDSGIGTDKRFKIGKTKYAAGMDRTPIEPIDYNAGREDDKA